MGIMHEEAIKGLLENLQQQPQPQQPEQQPEPDHPQIQVGSLRRCCFGLETRVIIKISTNHC